MTDTPPSVWSRIAQFATKAVAVATVALIVLAGVVVWRINGDANIRIQDIGLPQAFTTRGYTSSNVAQEILDQVYHIVDSSMTRNPSRKLRADEGAKFQGFKMTVAGQEITPTVVADVIAALRGDSLLHVGGEIILEKDSAELSLRVGNRSTKIPFAIPDTLIPDAVTRRAAEFVLETVDPFQLSMYLSANDSANDAHGHAWRLLQAQAHSATPRLRAQALTEIAQWGERMDYEMARFYMLAIDADPTYALSYVYLAKLRSDRHHPHTALAVLDDAPEGGGPWKFRISDTRAKVLNEMGRYQEALASARTAVRLVEGLPPRANAARALLALGRIDAADREYAHALFLDNSADTVRLEYATMLMLAGRYPAARSEIARVKSQELGAPVSILGTLISSRQSHRAPDLMGLSATGAASAWAWWLAWFAEFYSVAGHEEESLAFLDVARTRDTTVAEVRLGLAKAACREGDLEGAEAHHQAFLAADAKKHGSLSPVDPPCSFIDVQTLRRDRVAALLE